MPPRPKIGDHIARIDFAAFYADAFGGDAGASAEFYRRVVSAAAAERTPGGDAQRAKRLLHDTARVVWLADQIDRPDIAFGRPGWQVHFYMIAAESVAKRFGNFQGKGKSREHVVVFFRDLCTDAHRASLSRAFRQTLEFLGWEAAVSFLYDVRCDVAHEAFYYNFNMPDSPGEALLWVRADLSYEKVESENDASYVVCVTAEELRRIIVEGAVEAAKRLVPTATATS